jgi:hypothetical protein
MLILNMFIYKSFYEKQIQDIIIVQMYEIVRIQMHFWSNYLIFLFQFCYRCVDLGKIFKNKIYLFSFGQRVQKKIMVKVGYFCMGQRMM